MENIDSEENLVSNRKNFEIEEKPVGNMESIDSENNPSNYAENIDTEEISLNNIKIYNIEDTSDGISDISEDGEGTSDVNEDDEGTRDINEDGVRTSDNSGNAEGACDTNEEGEGAYDTSEDGEGTSDINEDGVRTSDNSGNGEGACDTNEDGEGINEVISFISSQKKNFASLLQILERSTELFESAFERYASITDRMAFERRPLSFYIARRLHKIHIRLKIAKSHISHITDLFQLLDSIIRATFQNLKSQYLHHARKLVHTLEETERYALKTLDVLTAVAELCRLILTDDPSYVAFMLDMPDFDSD